MIRRHSLHRQFRVMVGLPLLLPASIAGAKVVRGTPQQPHEMGSFSTADGNDLTNAAAATPQDEALAKASASLDAVTVKVRTSFEQTSQWTDAAEKYNDANAAVSADIAKAVAELSGHPDYMAAVAARDKAQADLDAVHASSTASAADIAAAAATALSARSAVTAIRTQAIAADPDVQRDRPRLEAALHAINDLRAQEEQAVRADPQWKLAKKQVDAAQTAADASHKK